jgi:hypothetical protein
MTNYHEKQPKNEYEWQEHFDKVAREAGKVANPKVVEIKPVAEPTEHSQAA